MNRSWIHPTSNDKLHRDHRELCVGDEANISQEEDIWKPKARELVAPQNTTVHKSTMLKELPDLTSALSWNRLCSSGTSAARNHSLDGNVPTTRIHVLINRVLYCREAASTLNASRFGNWYMDFRTSEQWGVPVWRLWGYCLSLVAWRLCAQNVKMEMQLQQEISFVVVVKALSHASVAGIP